VGVLDRFEKGIERAVNGAFAKAFRSEVQPVEIASALRRECDDRSSIVGRDRVIAPNSFVVELGPGDYERLGEWKDALGDELTAVVHDHARQQRYAFVGPVGVTFEQAADLDTGEFRVRSATSRPSGEPQYRSPGGDPGHGPAGGYPGPGGAGPGGPGAPGPGQGAGSGAPFGGGPFVGSAPPAPGYPPAGYPGAAPAYPGPDYGGGPYQPEYRGGEQQQPAGPGPGGPGAAAGAGWASAAHDPNAARTSVLEIDGQQHQLSKQVTVLGTFVDGERVHASDLNDGSVITVGRTRITFHAGQW